ncbi:MAG: M64 family metallopeptidase [Phocaeicola sp.]
MNTKLIPFIFALFSFLVACQEESDPESLPIHSNYTIEASSLSFKSITNGDSTLIRWKEKDVLELYEVENNNELIHKKIYSILPNSLSKDGKQAIFEGDSLQINKRYKAFYGEISLHNNQLVASSIATSGEIEKGALLSSSIIHIEGKHPQFLLNHEMSLLELEVHVPQDMATNELNITAIELTAPNRPFVNQIRLEAEGCSPYLLSDDDKKHTIAFDYNESPILLIAGQKALIKLPIYWNKMVEEVSGNFEITFIASNFKASTVSFPAQVMHPGILYQSALHLTNWKELSNQSVLWEIYEEMNLKEWGSLNWSNDQPITEWEGVTVDEYNRITELSLTQKAGTEIPTTLSKKLFELTALKKLSITGCINGTITEIGNLSKLEYLALVSTKIGEGVTGSIPNQLSELKYLNHLHLDGHLFSSTIPESIGTLKNLRHFCIVDCGATGGIPLFVSSNIDQYSCFSLHYNRLSGAIPQTLQKHDRFPYILKSIITQSGTGLQRDGLSYPFPHFVDYDVVNGTSIDSKEIIQSNNYTILYSWSTQSALNQAFLPQLKELEATYKDKGVAIITTYNESQKFDSEGGLSYLKNHAMNWLCTTSTPEGIYPEGGSKETPYVMVINSDEQIVFDKRLTNNSDDYSRLQSYLEEVLGGEAKYESTDYSKEGEVTQLQTASIGSGVDLIIMGDGFVDKDMEQGGKYESRTREAMEHIFSIEPMKSLRSYYNVYEVKAISKNEKIEGNNQTAFGSSFDEKSSISGNSSLIFQYAAKPSGVQLTKSHVVVILNSIKYAGTCWIYADGKSIAYVPYVADDSNEFSQIIHHEVVGHAIGRLLDEYIYYPETITPTYINAFKRDKNSYGMGANLTITPTDIPWEHFIGHPQYSMVDCYEGGYFFAKGVWRAEKNSCMNNNIPYFNAPSREEIVRRTKQNAGLPYSWEEFVTNDRYEPFVETRSTFEQYNKPPLAPPIFVE